MSKRIGVDASVFSENQAGFFSDYSITLTKRVSATGVRVA